MKLRIALVLLPLLPSLATGQGDPAAVQRIIKEGTQNSDVWETLEYPSHEIGPRLTGSTGLARANAWTRDEFRRLGLTGCEMVKWGDVPVRFDRGPCYARMVSPTEREFEFTARAWSAGTDGPVRGPVFRMPTTDDEYQAIAGDLDGAWVLSKSSRGRRRGRRDESDEERQDREAQEEIAGRVRAGNIAGVITGSRNDLVVTGGSWNGVSMDELPTEVSIQVTRGDFEAMEEALDGGGNVEVVADLAHYFTEGPFPVYNTVAEIRGSELPEEVVILSAHLDTWDGPGTQGTQDNGTGSSVMLEAARILMASGVEPRRTIRFCLWTGEEQGLYGSKGYVEQLSEDERALVSACFVDDGGTNYQGGLVCISSMEPMLSEAIAPAVAAFPDFDIANSVQDRMPRGGASDHASFNRAGIPGFFWIEKGKGGQEERDYRFVHHTQHDTTRYAVPEYLVQSATCSAVVAFNLAQAATMLPREEAEGDVDSEDGGGVGAAPDSGFQVQAGGLTGVWAGELLGQEAPISTFTMDLQVSKDGRVRGSVVADGSAYAIKSGRWDAATSKTSFSVPMETGPMAVEATLLDGALAGTVQMDSAVSFQAKPLAAMEAPINGAWEIYLPDFDATVDLSIEVGSDGVLRGWFRSTTSDSPLYQGTWDPKAGALTFEYDYPHAGRLPVSAKLVEGTLVGTIGEDTGFSGKLVPADG